MIERALEWSGLTLDRVEGVAATCGPDARIAARLRPFRRQAIAAPGAAASSASIISDTEHQLGSSSTARSRVPSSATWFPQAFALYWAAENDEYTLLGQTPTDGASA